VCDAAVDDVVVCPYIPTAVCDSPLFAFASSGECRGAAALLDSSSPADVDQRNKQVRQILLAAFSALFSSIPRTSRALLKSKRCCLLSRCVYFVSALIIVVRQGWTALHAASRCLCDSPIPPRE
jgi:hypothetical protein